MTKLFRVLYCSRNNLTGTPPQVAADIEGILGKSRENNSRDLVTGGLLFSEGCFAQVLEGPLSAIEAAFERIQCDGRHGDVTVVQSGPIAARDFPDWSMAFTGAAAGNSPVAATVLAGAFSGQSRAGEAMLDLLRGLVRREHDWLAPVI